MDVNAASLRLEAAQLAASPFALYKTHISRDGNQWCVLYGDNLQDGVAGFGDSPALAVLDFNNAWHRSHAEQIAGGDHE